MSLTILEGIDRTGKSSIADFFESKGYNVVHLSAPSKKYTQPGYAGPSYLDDMVELIQRGMTEDLILDRSSYGELVWPKIYNREPALSEEDIEILAEIEDSIGVRRILMHDPETESHWNRCVANNEPLTRSQFLRAKTLFDRLAKRYKFEVLDFANLPEEFKDINKKQEETTLKENKSLESTTVDKPTTQKPIVNGKSEQQLKLDKANAINDILSKRIIKGKTQIHDEIETEMRHFLNKKLGTILGNPDIDSFSEEETMVLKTFVKRLKEKESK